jgi:hypothetical protein
MAANARRRVLAQVKAHLFRVKLLDLVGFVVYTTGAEFKMV